MKTTTTKLKADTKLIIKQKEKQRSRCAKSPTVSARLDCVFKSGPFPYYLAYSYIKCSHKIAVNKNNTTTMESVYNSKHNVLLLLD